MLVIARARTISKVQLLTSLMTTATTPMSPPTSQTKQKANVRTRILVPGSIFVLSTTTRLRRGAVFLRESLKTSVTTRSTSTPSRRPACLSQIALRTSTTVTRQTRRAQWRARGIAYDAVRIRTQPRSTQEAAPPNLVARRQGHSTSTTRIENENVHRAHLPRLR